MDNKIKTFKDAYEFAWKIHWGQDRYQKSNHASNVDSLFRNHLENSIAKRSLSRIDRKYIKQLRAKLAAKSKNTANKCMSLISKVYNILIDHEICQVNPAYNIPQYPQRKRDNLADTNTLKKIEHIITSRYLLSSKSEPAVFIMIMLYTGARPTSIERSKIGDLASFQKNGQTYGVIKVEGKIYEDHQEKDTIIIPPKVYKLINKDKHPSWSVAGSHSNAKALWYEIRKEIDREDLWLRDLRRSFASAALSNGVDISVIAELLNHKSVQTTKIYAKLDTKARVDAIDKVSNVI